MTQVKKSAGIIAGTALIAWLGIAVNRPAGPETAHRTQTSAEAKHDQDRVWQQDLAVIAARNR